MAMAWVDQVETNPGSFGELGPCAPWGFVHVPKNKSTLINDHYANL